MYEYPFEKLKVWNKGRQLAVEIYSVAAKFSQKDKSGMDFSLRNTAVEFTTALSEGNWKNGPEKSLKTIENAHGHLMELLSLIIVAKDLDLIEETVYNELRKDINEISVILISFKKGIQNRVEKKDEAA